MGYPDPEDLKGNLGLLDQRDQREKLASGATEAFRDRWDLLADRDQRGKSAFRVTKEILVIAVREGAEGREGIREKKEKHL